LRGCYADFYITQHRNANNNNNNNSTTLCNNYRETKYHQNAVRQEKKPTGSAKCNEDLLISGGGDI